MIYFIGMVWKRSKTAAWITVLVSFAVNMIWTFATPSWATGPWAINMYPVTVCSIVLGIVTNLILPGEVGWRRSKEHKLLQNAVPSVDQA